MFQPGKETNIPTSSGQPMGMNPTNLTNLSVLSVNSYTLTLGALVLFVTAVWVYVTFLKK